MRGSKLPTGTRVPNLNLYGDSTNGISSKLKMHENIEKTRFYKIVLVTISINRDMVLKWKLGHLVRTDFLPLKRNSFYPTQPSFDSTVIILSRDVVHKFEKLTFAGKKLTVSTFTTNTHHSTFYQLPLSATFVFAFSYERSHWSIYYCGIFPPFEFLQQFRPTKEVISPLFT